MEMYAKFIQVIPTVEGEKDGKSWKRGGFVVRTMEDIERSIAFDVIKEEIINALPNIPIGSTVRINFSIESREFGLRWYTSARCYFLDVVPSR